MESMPFLHAPIRALSSPMSTPPEHPAPDRTRWTGEKAATFLKALAQYGKVAPAARGVGMSREAAYRLRARAPKFAELWLVAMREAQRQRIMRRRSKQVHPLLAQNPLPDHEAADAPLNADRLERAGSHPARARSQMAQRK